MHNYDVVFHTANGKFVYMLYGQDFFVHTTNRKLVHMLYGQFVFVHTTYGKVVYMLYGKVFHIFHIDKYMSDDTEQVHNEYIDTN